MRRLSVGVVLFVLSAATVVLAQGYVPTATEADHILAKFDVSRDGRTVTIRGTVSNETRLCIEPARGVFGPVRCFLVEDIRKGALTLR